MFNLLVPLFTSQRQQPVYFVGADHINDTSPSSISLEHITNDADAANK